MRLPPPTALTPLHAPIALVTRGLLAIRCPYHTLPFWTLVCIVSGARCPAEVSILAERDAASRHPHAPIPFSPSPTFPCLHRGSPTSPAFDVAQTVHEEDPESSDNSFAMSGGMANMMASLQGVAELKEDPTAFRAAAERAAASRISVRSLT
jgi:hypothetical protein